MIMTDKITYTTVKVKLQTLTPVHIGSGRELMKGADFFYETNKKRLGKVNPKKLYPEYIDDIDTWSAAIMDGKDIYQEFLQNRQVPLEAVCDEILPVRSFKQYKKNGEIEYGKELKEFIRNGMTQNPLIAGSSIKGAVRTALLSKAIIESDRFKQEFDQIFENFKGDFDRINKKFYPNYRKKINDLKKIFKNFVDRIERLYHNKFDAMDDHKKYNPQNDIFKYIQVSDAEGSKDNLVVDTFQTLNLDRDKNWYIENSLTQSVEVFEGEVNFSIRINDEFWGKNKFNIRNVTALFQKIYNHNKELLEEQLEYFKEDLEDNLFMDANVGENIIDQLKNFRENLKENEYLMRMSAGSGWDFMTGAWLKAICNDDQWEKIKEFLVRNRKNMDFPFPKTRRITSEYKLPGFVKLKILN